MMNPDASIVPEPAEAQPEPSTPGPIPTSSRIGERIASVLRWAVVLAVLPAAALAYMTAQMPTLLFFLLVGGVAWGGLVRLIAAVRGRLRLVPWRRAADRANRPFVIQAIHRALFWAIAGFVVAWTIPSALLDADTLREIRLVAVGAAVLNILLAALWVPAGRRVHAAWTALPILGWLFLATECLRIVAGPLGTHVVLTAPFEGDWAVGQGGRSALVNHHYVIPAQSHALDLVMVRDGRARVGDPAVLASYPAFGAILKAPADGRVARAVDGHPDMEIGQTDVESLVGNHVVIEMAPGRYVLLAHLQSGSVLVEEGQIVAAGEPIARCGNSGNTSQPHLHLQVQSGPDFREPGLRTYPMAFADVRLVRNGTIAGGSPRRNDILVGGDSD